MGGEHTNDLYCNGCGRFIEKKNFIKHKNELHINGVHLYCKDCCRSISQKIMLKYCRANVKPDIFSYKLAIRHICSFFDLPYLAEVAEHLYDIEYNMDKDRNWNYVFQYQSHLKELGYDEGIYWNDLSGNTFTAWECIKEKDTRPNSVGDLELFNEQTEMWGTGIKSLDDFIFLNKTYISYSEGEDLPATAINMLKNLCHEELKLKKAREHNTDSKEISSILKNIEYYYGKLKLDNFKLNNAKSLIEQQLENDAYLFEKRNPIEEGVDVLDLSDRLGIDKDYDNIMRSLGNKVTGNKEYPKLTTDDIKRGKKT